MTWVGGSVLGQQLLDDHFRLLVFAFAEVVVPDAALRVGEVQGRPVVVAEGTPYRVVVVDRDRVTDPHVPLGAADVVGVVLERELGCVHADHDQPEAGVFPGPGAEVGELAEPVDAGVGPEAGQDDVPPQPGRRQRRRVEPPRRAAERRQLTLDGQPGRGRVQPGGCEPVCCHDRSL